MLKINSITLKNFLSVGAVTQSINFAGRGLTLILGENLDQGGGGARNGVGKSTILQGLSYALYDSPITSIKKDNLINKTNSKNMLVSVEFELNGNKYRVERGRKPNVLRFYINGTESKDDEAQGENRKTQIEINRYIGMSQNMFKHIIVLSTYNLPFLFMRQNEQRTVIEELLGITQLSQKADILKYQIRSSKNEVRDEETKIKTITNSNEGIKKSISQLEAKSTHFENEKKKNIITLAESIESLEHIDIDAELELHKKLEEYNLKNTDLKLYNKYLKEHNDSITDLNERLNGENRNLKNANDSKCPTCGQNVHDASHKKIINNIQKVLDGLENKIIETKNQYAAYEKKIENIGELAEQPITFYNKISDAYEHRENLQQLKTVLSTEEEKDNTFDDQIASLNENAIQKIDYNHVNDLKKLQEHQEFLYKLLTSKDSFIRKKIIEQNLTYLNSRLSYYLTKMGLPHNVEFKNDLSVEIVLLGQDFDFGQLSRGQQNRLILALSWAFRDVWESTGHPINILFIDEMIDSGIDTIGVENTIEILKKKAREQKKDIFLISHKEELINRVHNVMMVIMENGFTNYINEYTE